MAVGGVVNVRSLSRRHCHLTHGDLEEALGNGLLRCRYSLGLEGMEGHTTLGSTVNKLLLAEYRRRAYQDRKVLVHCMRPIGQYHLLVPKTLPL